MISLSAPASGRRASPAPAGEATLAGGEVFRKVPRQRERAGGEGFRKIPRQRSARGR